MKYSYSLYFNSKAIESKEYAFWFVKNKDTLRLVQSMARRKRESYRKLRMGGLWCGMVRPLYVQSWTVTSSGGDFYVTEVLELYQCGGASLC